MSSNKPITQLIIWLTIWVALVLISSPLIAEEAIDQRISKSISYTKSTDLDKETIDKQLNQAEADIMEPLNKDGFRLESSIKASHFGSENYGDIYIFDASTDLISDINYDGFYHRFSVAIDVDTTFETSYVYAKLYLSFEGGPWNHYATSNNYHIYGDSEADSFVIETELADGFPPGYYDIKVDLYNADTGQWIMDYGPYEDSSLSALPLEDSYYDDFYDGGSYQVESDIVIGAHAGSMSWWLLMLPVLTVAVRRYNAN